MGTRCHIKIIKKHNNPVYVYHHTDGYPDGVGEELRQWLNPTTYLYKAKTPTELSKALNTADYYYYIDDGLHGDEEYVYLIDMDKKSVKCFPMEWREKEESVLAKKSIFSFKYGGEPIDFAFDEIKMQIKKSVKKYRLGKNKEALNKLFDVLPRINSWDS